jgi:protein subunit release factor B
MGFSLTVSDSRSQVMNRETACRRLLEEINEAAMEKKLEQLAEASRERRRKAKRSRGTKAKLVESKRRRSGTKKMRGNFAAVSSGEIYQWRVRFFTVVKSRLVFGQ